MSKKKIHFFRFDRSMSLPLHSSQKENHYYDGEYTESHRRMDFALCEIGSGPRSSSPLIDVEAVSDDESDVHNSTVGQSTKWSFIFVVYRCCSYCCVTQ
ncbi:hypothetical protein NQ315_011410 [Exocentrus adspersus]|uniref:Uncharacterized protein n=1 Tax=Exocentrus adspersus TaxID=1586481 RepID=A0AAV8VJV4_9CUCU|nr:hypothetical protein NQ315_011410 [Exocentrus adspersus]